MHPQPTSAVAEFGIRRVDRTFAFLDLCGFTDYADTHGDEAAVSELTLLRSIVRAVAPQYGVRIDKWLGDGALLVAVDEEPLVSAVVAIVTRFHRLGDLPLRAGMAGGSVVLLEGDDYVGGPVNLAARLCEVAPPGAVTGAAGLTIPADVVAVPSSTVVVKGMFAPVETVELRSAGAAGY